MVLFSFPVLGSSLMMYIIVSRMYSSLGYIPTGRDSANKHDD